jgi:ribosomal protein S18 acetylase RimI-like enzyme
VLPACRGTGCAEELMRAFERALRERGVGAVGLSVNSDNARAIRFYRKAGWQVAQQRQHSVAFAKRL